MVRKVLCFIVFCYISLFSTTKGGLYYEAGCGNNEKLKKIVKSGIDLNETDSDGDLALSLAAQNGYLESCKILLRNGAKVNKKDDFGRTALMDANNLKVIRFLLKNGAEIRLRDQYGNDPFLLSAESYNIEKAKLLLELGININTVNKLKQTALMKAILSCTVNDKLKMKYVEILLKNKIDVNLKDKDNKTAYILSKERGYSNIANLLLKYGAYKEEYKLDPNSLITALVNKNYKRAKEMIENGVDINFLAGSGFTPLMCSIGNIEIMKLLLEKNVDVNMKNRFSLTALIAAVIINDENAVKLLLDNGADINVVYSVNNSTPLMLAVKNNNRNIIRMLKEKSIDLNFKDSYGNTALLEAISVGFIDFQIIEFLILNTEQINVFNNLGISPLFKAVGLDKIKLVEFLLKNGADINQKNKYGFSALTIARKSKNNPKMIKLLKAYGSKE